MKIPPVVVIDSLFNVLRPAHKKLTKHKKLIKTNKPRMASIVNNIDFKWKNNFLFSFVC
jgi:hypothetical protein